MCCYSFVGAIEIFPSVDMKCSLKPKLVFFHLFGVILTFEKNFISVLTVS